MGVLQWVGIGVLIVLLALAALFFRRAAITRGGGTIDVSLRLTTLVAGRGWSHGLARFKGDELRWYRVFSFSPRPRRILSRRDVSVQGRRQPDDAERFTMPADWVVIRCADRRSSVEIAMARSTLTGFLSWIEAAPPGSSSRRLAAPPH
ncbi:DUF2550 domain-containing protein [Virgisporangium aurantiacum]|uniref:DUF2550 domain-containing protein n=1 Tax=Virgisporangium aurantiacum TaxID=175570 RepID=A0A8J3YYU8_9ACTN|nr:DUF2550 domain-containing protein [Virgisporangium aurantiacum]GIJ53178.1 hypothetical protein Vau01_006940 [Virgisporangium aurantiacum]